MKKLILLTTLLFSIVGFAEGGIEVPFTTDGKLHEDKILNRYIYSTDLEIKIEKRGGKYIEINYYNDDGSDDVEERELKVYKNVALCDTDPEYTVCTAYDIKLKKVVFLDKNDMKIIYTEGGLLEESED